MIKYIKKIFNNLSTKRNKGIHDKSQYGKETIIMKNSYISKDSKIGMYSYIGFNTRITRAIIGNYTSIANNVSIGIGEHPIDNISTSAWFIQNKYKELTKNKCIIGNDVWIGVDAIILRGVTIGDGAVIGANSVVTKDIPDFAVAVGSPAKIIKYRFDPKKQNLIKASNWWFKEIEEAKQIHNKIKEKL